MSTAQASASTTTERPLDRHESLLTPQFLQSFRAALSDDDPASIKRVYDALEIPDEIKLFGLLPEDERHKLIDVLDGNLSIEVLVDLEEAVLSDVLHFIPPEKLGPAFGKIDAGKALRLLAALEKDLQDQILKHTPLRARSDIELGLHYPEDTAGRVMQRNLVAVPDFWKVGRAIEYLQKTENLPQTFYEIYVVNSSWQLVGSVLTNHIMRANPGDSLKNLMNAKPFEILADTKEKIVIDNFRKYHLVSAPIIDRKRRLLGMITIDDAIKMIDEQATEDIKGLGGVTQDHLSDTIFETARGRFSWLFVNLMTAILASAVINLFEGALARMVALAILMPIVASMGGIAGTQTLTVAVRALATEELMPANQRRMILREVGVGIMNGVLLACLMGLVAAFWFGHMSLGIVLATAIIINMPTAALAGIVIPLLIEKLGADPALSAGVFVTTFTDVIGFMAFLGLASFILL